MSLSSNIEMKSASINKQKLQSRKTNNSTEFYTIMRLRKCSEEITDNLLVKGLPIDQISSLWDKERFSTEDDSYCYKRYRYGSNRGFKTMEPYPTYAMLLKASYAKEDITATTIKKQETVVTAGDNKPKDTVDPAAVIKYPDNVVPATVIINPVTVVPVTNIKKRYTVVTTVNIRKPFSPTHNKFPDSVVPQINIKSADTVVSEINIKLPDTVVSEISIKSPDTVVPEININKRDNFIPAINIKNQDTVVSETGTAETIGPTSLVETPETSAVKSGIHEQISTPELEPGLLFIIRDIGTITISVREGATATEDEIDKAERISHMLKRKEILERWNASPLTKIPVTLVDTIKAIPIITRRDKRRMRNVL